MIKVFKELTGFLFCYLNYFLFYSVDRTAHRLFSPKSRNKRLQRWSKIFDQPVKNDKRTNEGDDYIACCTLDYPYFKENYNLIEIDEIDALNGDVKAIQQSNVTGNTTFIIEEVNATTLGFSQGSVKVV